MPNFFGPSDEDEPSHCVVFSIINLACSSPKAFENAGL
jgi:hypothetical protein